MAGASRIWSRMTEPPGTQNERTSLAWVRTGLGLAGCALLAGRLAISRDQTWAVGAALAAALLAVGVLGWAHDRYRRAARRLARQAPVDFALPALVLTLAVVAVGLLGLLLIAL
jgi:putative membrane protein